MDAETIARQNEELYVHSVYERIADHFSRTRYKPWPGITSFFESLEPGSVGLDAGCGNGKYLGLRSAISTTRPPEQRASQDFATSQNQPTSKSKGKGRASDSVTAVPAEQATREDTIPAGPLLTLGLDRSSGLVGIAKERGHEVLVGDAIDMPWREGSFDFAISIATIHHFTTRARRKESVKSILRTLNKSRGKLFIQVWAYEQEAPAPETGLLLSEAALSKLEEERSTAASSTAGSTKVKKPRKMDKLEPARMASACNGEEPEADADKQDVFVPWKLQGKDGRTVTVQGTEDEKKEEQTYQRYYHLFKAGELRSLVEDAARDLDLHELKIEPEHWEEGNWWIRASFAEVDL